MNDDRLGQLAEATEAEAIFQMHSAPDDAQMEMLGGSVCRIGGATAIRTDAFPGFSISRVAGFSSPPEDSMIGEIEEFYKGREGIFALQIPPLLVTGSVEELLARRGYAIRNKWARFVRDTSEVDIERKTSSLVIREIGVEEGDKFAELVTSAFDFPKVTNPLISSVVGSDGWKFSMAFDGDKPVSTGCVFFNGEMAWNCFATTLPEYRGMGAQGALLKARIDAARLEGCSHITAETHLDNASYRNMLRFGYKMLYDRSNYVPGG
ncbi:MAG: GNAT family N-acetyltransferase [Ignavibacteria bacterium]|nr:GNAT family N-acetyltransferase [Ignavibacteria bacterium]